jgi:hypothetical protein
MLKYQNLTFYNCFGKRRKPIPEGLFFKKQKIVGGQSENLPFFIWRDSAANIGSRTAYNYSKNRIDRKRAGELLERELCDSKAEQHYNYSKNRTEQNRTEQNRTEQNRTEQNRTEQNRFKQDRKI